jgi:tetratricopeptide (TPR) repeat protein
MIGELERTSNVPPGDTIASYDEVISQAAETGGLAERIRLAEALYYKGFELRALGRSEEAVETFDELVRRFGDAVEPAIRECLASALLQEGAAFVSLGRPQSAVQAWDGFCAKFAGDAEFRDRVDWLTNNRDVLLGEIGWERAGALLDHLIVHFEESTDPLAEEWLAYLMTARADELVRGGATDLARTAYEDLVARFARSGNEKVAWYVANGRTQQRAIAVTEQNA